MPVFDITVETPLYFGQQCVAFTQAYIAVYGSVQDADNYFRSKIANTVRDWTDSEQSDKEAALREATRRIDALNFIGTTNGEGTYFPTAEHGTPRDVQIACYEIALKLLSGIDPDTEADNLSVTAQGYAGGRSTFDRSFVQEHIRSGIPSAFAWSILRPFLCDPQSIKLRRGD